MDEGDTAPRGREMASGHADTGCLEACSDGVFAVAITLLVFGIATPHGVKEGHLARALLDQWPSYASYVVSFLTIATSG
jgi:uncharacterized membrane protein